MHQQTVQLLGHGHLAMVVHQHLKTQITPTHPQVLTLSQ